MLRIRRRFYVFVSAVLTACAARAVNVTLHALQVQPAALTCLVNRICLAIDAYCSVTTPNCPVCKSAYFHCNYTGE